MKSAGYPVCFTTTSIKEDSILASCTNGAVCEGDSTTSATTGASGMA